jgi:hypothetical protein
VVKITAAQREAAINAVGNDGLEDEQIQKAVATYSDWSDVDLKSHLLRLEAAFNRSGGRGVDLADAIDEARIALAVLRS